MTHIAAGGRLRPVHPKAKERCLTFLQAVHRNDLAKLLPATRLSTAQWAGAICKIYDQLATDDAKRAWVEKTPRHLHHLDLVDQYFDGARVIHIVRDGPSTVASLFDVAAKHPDQWGVRSLDDCTKRWLQDLEITLSWASHPNHLVVRYAQLMAEPQRVMDAVCRHLGLPFAAATRQPDNLATGAEVWKDGIHRDLVDSGRAKFHQLPSDAQQTVLDTLGAAAQDWQ